ncbi:hypothetical protein [Moorena producens]|uniref:hypothetical protein n=1 Tax=Moorena producens TaxID=1155739 RepID=UPI003C7120B3
MVRQLETLLIYSNCHNHQVHSIFLPLPSIPAPVIITKKTITPTPYSLLPTP